MFSYSIRVKLEERMRNPSHYTDSIGSSVLSMLRKVIRREAVVHTCSWVLGSLLVSSSTQSEARLLALRSTSLVTHGKYILYLVTSALKRMKGPYFTARGEVIRL